MVNSCRESNGDHEATCEASLPVVGRLRRFHAHAICLVVHFLQNRENQSKPKSSSITYYITVCCGLDTKNLLFRVLASCRFQAAIDRLPLHYLATIARTATAT